MYINVPMSTIGGLYCARKKQKQNQITGHEGEFNLSWVLIPDTGMTFLMFLQ